MKNHRCIICGDRIKYDRVLKRWTHAARSTKTRKHRARID